MWNIVLTINSLCWSIAFGYFIYSIGASIFMATWRPLEIGIFLVILISLSELIFGILSD